MPTPAPSPQHGADIERAPALTGSASDYFGAMSQSYDSLIRRSVPRYDEMLERLVDYAPPRPVRILELGCGTGNLSMRLAATFPHAKLSLVDASSEMIALTRARLDDVGASGTREFEFITARFEALDLESESFDLVISSISLHHVVDKKSLYRRVRAALRNGGTFSFADQIRGEPESNHDLNWRRWLEFTAQPGNCTPEEIESLLSHAAAHDHYTPLSEHFALLGQSRFKEIDCVWRNLMWGIVTATAA